MRKAAFSILTVALMLALVVSAQAAVELYEVQASPYVPAFIDYKLNCQSDVTISILPSTAGGTPTGPAIKTVTFLGQSRGFHRYIWVAETNAGGTAPQGYYVAQIQATHNQAAWGPIIGLYINSDWTHEYAPDPLPAVPDTEGFYGIAINNNPASAYYGRIYTSHKVQKDIFMYGPDGAYLGKFNDAACAWGASAPWDLAVADDGYVYVSDRSNTTVYCFTPDGNLVSSGPGTYFRGIFARTDGTGVTHLFMTGSSTGTLHSTVSADHMTWSTPTLAYNTGGGDGWDAFGVWVSPSLQVAYAGCLQGPNVGTTKWIDAEGDFTYAKDNAFDRTIASPGTDIAMYDSFLWVTKMVGFANDNPTTTAVNERSRALVKVNPNTGALISDDYNYVTWGHMVAVDGVGNPAVTYGKSTGSWAQRYWAMFAEPGITTATKSTTAFYLGATPAPVVVPDSSVWTPDNTIAADDTDTGSVSFKCMDVNGWADITSVTLDLRPLGYASNAACTIAQDVSDPTGKTAIATKTGIKAKVGTRCTTSFGQPVHFLTATPRDTTGGSNADTEEVKLNVTGDPMFDAYIRHRRVTSWYLSGAQIVATGGGIPGTTDPRAKGPFTYTSAMTDATGYASLEMSAGTFAVKAAKLGFGSETPVNITVPYTGYTMDLYLRPMTITEVRAATYGTKVNMEGVCFAQPAGYDWTTGSPVLSVNGLASRTDTLVKRNQWYVCDSNSPGNGMLCLVTEPSDSFILQWDDPAGTDLFGNSTFIGTRPAEGQTVMITGLLDAPGGHERRVLVQNADLEAGMAAIPSTVDRVYLNRGNLGGLPGTPAAQTIANIEHGITAGFSEAWGKFVQVPGCTVVKYVSDGSEPGVTTTDPIPYYVVSNAAGNTMNVAYCMPTTLGITPSLTVGATYTVTGAGSRRVRYGSGSVLVRKAGDVALTSGAPAAPAALSVVRAANDGDPANVHGLVTAKIGSSLWIEAADRSIGIRVMANPGYVNVGDDIQVVGNFDIQDGEMVIVPSMAILIVTAGGTAPAAIDMRSREIGGVAAGTTPGVSTGRGALNVGLKVHFLGMVTAVAADSYYLWDGANRSDAPTSDGSGNIGVLIEAAPPAGVVAWKDWVEVVGPVSAKDLGGVIAPTIIPISATKVTAFDTVTSVAGDAIAASWNLLSVPAAPAAVSDGDEWTAKPFDPYIVLGATGSPDDIDGRLYRWENCTGGLNIWDQWSEVGGHGPFGGIVLGDGYWLESAADTAVSYSGKASTLDQWIGICATGWTIIGQPKDHNTFIADVLVHDGSSITTMFDAVMTNSWIDCTGYWWDNATQGLVDIGIPDCWSSTDTLMPWHGYWIQAYRGDLALIVPEAPAAP